MGRNGQLATPSKLLFVVVIIIVINYGKGSNLKVNEILQISKRNLDHVILVPRFRQTEQ